MLDAVQTLRSLVRVPSVNPMGRAASGPEYLEEALTQHLEQLFERLGLPWQRQEVEPGRSNIVARLEGRPPLEQGGQLLMFEAHQDTVPVDGMSVPPFDAQVRQGRVYGRGACDTKGGMAGMLTAIARLAGRRPARMPTIVMACTVNEEYGFTGATGLTKLWSDGRSPVCPRAPDAAIVAEPTALDVVVAHKGVLRWKCRTSGRACHSSQPERGDNAIYKMGKVLSAFQQYAEQSVPQLGQHPRLGPPRLSVGTVSGGISVNTVPDRCTIEIDRRLLPGEDLQEAYRHAVRYVADHCQIDPPPQHDPPYLAVPALSDRLNQDLADRLCRAAQDCGAASRPIGVPYGTDAAAFAAAGIPTVVFGPGHIEQAHTDDEWIAIDQLQLAAEILYQFASQAF